MLQYISSFRYSKILSLFFFSLSFSQSKHNKSNDSSLFESFDNSIATDSFTFSLQDTYYRESISAVFNISIFSSIQAIPTALTSKPLCIENVPCTITVRHLVTFIESLVFIPTVRFINKYNVAICFKLYFITCCYCWNTD